SFAMTFPKQAPVGVQNVPQQLLEGLSIQPSKVIKNRQAYFDIYENADQILQLKSKSDLLKTVYPLDLVATAP
ncbi:phenazine biosynthesis protein PhzF, partial [Pseudoalteromonas aliena]